MELGDAMPDSVRPSGPQHRFDGAWYEPRSRVDLVLGNGKVIFDRAKEGN